MTLTKEREAEIREQSDKPYYLNYAEFTGSEMKELLAEIDRLRSESCADLIGQEHRLGSRIDILQKERDNYKWEYENVCKFAIGYEQERDKLKTDVQDLARRLKRACEILRKPKRNIELEILADELEAPLEISES